MLDSDELIRLFHDHVDRLKPHAGGPGNWTIEPPYELTCHCATKLMTSAELVGFVDGAPADWYADVVLAILKAAGGIALVYGAPQPYAECSPPKPGDPNDPRTHRRSARRADR